MDEDGVNFTLLKPLIYISPSDGSTKTIPIGFKSDGCSTPKIIWTLIPPSGIYLRGAILHDWYYRETWLPREYCDEKFLEAMVSLGVGYVLRDTIYENLRLWGGFAFEKDRKALAEREAAERSYKVVDATMP